MGQLRIPWINFFIAALAWTFLILLIDIVFSLAAPKSIFFISAYSFYDKVLVYGLDGLFSFPLISFLILTRHLTGKQLALIIYCFAGIIYLINWATYLIIGEFLGLEGIRFVSQNFEHILWHMSQISCWYIVILIALIISPFAFYLLIKKTKIIFANHVLLLKKTQIVLFEISFLLLLLSLIFFSVFFKNLPQIIKIALKFRTSPQLSLLLDHENPNMSVRYQPGMKKIVVHWKKQGSWDQYKKNAETKSLNHPVILIVIESLRSDVLDTNAIMPNLYQLKTESISLKAFTPSNVSDYAWPSIFTSQYPLRSNYRYYYPRHVNYPRIAIYDILKEFGYKTAIFSAQNEQWCGMINFFNSGSLDIFFSADLASQGQQYVAKEDSGFASFVKLFRLKGKLDDAVVADKTIEWVSKINTQKFFIGLNFQRPHFPYTWPESFQPLFPYGQPGQWFYPKNQLEGMRGRYFNALRYTDEQISKIIESLKQQELYNKSIIIVTGDHGEAFYEHGSTCHANSLFNETAITSVIIKPPENSPDLSPKKTPELIDIAPTILRMLGLPPHDSFQGKNLFDPSPTVSPIFITVNSPIANQDVIVVNEWKLIQDYRYNSQFLFNLLLDPNEKVNLIKTNPLKARELLYQLSTWRHEQLKYYSDTSLQKKFYPPKFSLEN